MKITEMNKSQLRAVCDKYGIEWDKKADDEESLIAKIRKHKAGLKEPAAEEPKKESAKKSRVKITDVDADGNPVEEGADTGPDKSIKSEWNLKKRAETDEIVDKKTGKKRVRPVDCFGWLHEKGNNECAICPHAKPCEKLSAEADLNLLADMEEQPVVKEEAPKVEEKPKKAKLTEASVVKVNVTKDIIAATDDDLKPFYKHLYKKFGGNECKVRSIINVFGEYFEVEDRAAILTELVKTMIENEELTVIK